MYPALETNYNGYRFRSRLEARWAVFFDTLGVEYRYEAEGFDLDRIKYLPDFWLPQQDCYIEIKGQEPSRDEIRKAELLTTTLNKKVYIFGGDVWVPDVTTTIPKNENDEYIPSYEKNAYLFDASGIIIYGDDTASPCYRRSRHCEHGVLCPSHLEFPPSHLARALYRAELISPYGDFYRLQITKDNELVCLAPTYEETWQRNFPGHAHIPLPTPLKEVEKEFIALLPCKPDTWEWSVGGLYGVSHLKGYVWCECPVCHKVGITFEGKIYKLPCYQRDDHYFYEPEPHETWHKTSRLTQAYTAARQERFRH